MNLPSPANEPLDPSALAACRVEVSPLTALLLRALIERADAVELVDAADYLLSPPRRQNAKRGASIELLTPDEIVVSLLGEPEKRGKLLVAWIPAKVLQELPEPERLIQTPAEAAASGGPLIVVP